MLKKVLIITSVSAVISVGIFFKIYEPSASTEQSKVSYKEENYIKNNDADKKEEVTPKEESSSANTDKQTNNANPEKSNNSVNTNNKQNIASKPQNLNSTATKNTSEAKKTTVTSTPKVTVPTIYYDRTTSIYENDNKTLIRVEYYSNNKLAYYSVVEQFDVTTTSYVEKIYKYNYETNTEVLVRTDIYSNGTLVKSY